MHAPQSVPPGSYPHWHGSNSLSAAPLLTTKYETSPTQTLKRYERSPPTTLPTASWGGTNRGSNSRDIGLELEQQPVQAQQMTEGREKGEHLEGMSLAITLPDNNQDERPSTLPQSSCYVLAQALIRPSTWIRTWEKVRTNIAQAFHAKPVPIHVRTTLQA
jgi:hypothetical protein